MRKNFSKLGALTLKAVIRIQKMIRGWLFKKRNMKLLENFAEDEGIGYLLLP